MEFSSKQKASLSVPLCVYRLWIAIGEWLIATVQAENEEVFHELFVK